LLAKETQLLRMRGFNLLVAVVLLVVSSIGASHGSKVPGAGCTNHYSECEEWRNFGYCKGQYAWFMNTYCCLACKDCRNDVRPVSHCQYWRSVGYCGETSIYRYFLHKNCYKTCSSCTVGRWNDWSAWSGCSAACGEGTRKRTRTCAAGQVCNGEKEQTEKCTGHVCPINGGWSDWNDWSECDQKCAGGSQTRYRTCTNPKQRYGGKACEGPSQETRACNTRPCINDGKWSSWSDWGKCDKECSGGTQTRSRTCTNPPPSHGGRPCQGQSQESRSCNAHPCPVDGGWSDFAGWTSCTKTCGGGTQTRSRTCTKPAPSHGGRPCQGQSQERRSCNVYYCPVDGGWSGWSYTSCTASCGGGTQTKYRTCTRPEPSWGGRYCQGPHQETVACNENPCKIDGGWTDWSYTPGFQPTGECYWYSYDCHNGKLSIGCSMKMHRHYRSCTNPKPQNGGKDCEGKRFVRYLTATDKEYYDAGESCQGRLIPARCPNKVGNDPPQC